MIEITKDNLFYNESEEEKKDNYRNTIMSIKHQGLNFPMSEKKAFTEDGSCFIGFCNEYKVSINSKFPCPFDKRIDKNSKNISFSTDDFEFQEKQSLKTSPVLYQQERKTKPGYACQDYCFMSEQFYDIEGRITEYGEMHLRNRLKNFLIKA